MDRRGHVHDGIAVSCGHLNKKLSRTMPALSADTVGGTDFVTTEPTAGGLAVNRPKDAGKGIATGCTSLAWFQPDGRTTPEQIAKEYAQMHHAYSNTSPPDAPSKWTGIETIW